MKVKMTISNALVETKHYVDAKTGNARDRSVMTLAGMTESGEMLGCVVYGDKPDDFANAPKSGASVTVDIYKYEASNGLMGQAWARSFAPNK